MEMDSAGVAAWYDREAATYVTEYRDELAYKPLDRALLTTLADDVAGRGGSDDAGDATGRGDMAGRGGRGGRGGGVFADLGAGPGQIGAWVAGRGVAVTACDLSPTMAGIARSQLGLPASTGSLTALPFRTGSLSGATAFYCLIHLDPPAVAAAARELARVLRPGGPVLAAFHVETERPLPEVEIYFRLVPRAEVTDAFAAAGLVVEAVLERRPYPEEFPTRRAYVLARKPAG